jgi:hypothetical protein
MTSNSNHEKRFYSGSCEKHINTVIIKDNQSLFVCLILVLFKLDVNLSDSCDYCKITNIISVLKYVDNRHAEKSLKCFDQLRK